MMLTRILSRFSIAAGCCLAFLAFGFPNVADAQRPGKSLAGERNVSDQEEEEMEEEEEEEEEAAARDAAAQPARSGRRSMGRGTPSEESFGRNRGAAPSGRNVEGDRGAAPSGRSARGDQGRRPSTNSPGATQTVRRRFINLLENKDLNQFRGYQDEAIGEGWSLDGNGKYLYFDGTGGGDVITREVYDNFDLQVEWKVADGANSGIMYRVSLGDAAPYKSGPEYQILDDTDHSDGKSELTAAGALYGLYPAADKELRPVGDWNKTRIIVDGNKITHYLNSKKVLEAEIGSDEWNKRLGESKFKDWEKFAKNPKGHIAFQDHGNEVWFRNIRIKRLESSQLTDEAAAPEQGERAAPSSRSRGGSREFGRGDPETSRTNPRSGTATPSRSNGARSGRGATGREADAENPEGDEDPKSRTGSGRNGPAGRIK